MEQENILEHVNEVAPYFQQQLRTLHDIPLVGDVRGVGLMAAIEMTIAAESEEELLARDFAIGIMMKPDCPLIKGPT